MIRVWRLCRAKHAGDPLSGEGARLFGGRWNAKGTRMVYCAATQSLACMEALVHLDLQDLPKDYQAVGIDIPDGVSMKRLAATGLPPDWKQVPGPESLKELGTAWAASGKEAVLVVPSAVIPDELNYLINPDHPDVKLLRVLPAVPFVFDGRLNRA
jgi:RES domain-containing protein